MFFFGGVCWGGGVRVNDFKYDNYRHLSIALN